MCVWKVNIHFCRDIKDAYNLSKKTSQVKNLGYCTGLVSCSTLLYSKAESSKLSNEIVNYNLEAWVLHVKVAPRFLLLISWTYLFIWLTYVCIHLLSRVLGVAFRCFQWWTGIRDLIQIQNRSTEWIAFVCFQQRWPRLSCSKLKNTISYIQPWTVIFFHKSQTSTERNF